MLKPISRFLSCTLFLFPVAASAQNRIGTGEAETLYQQFCATCHGVNFEGGLGGSLVDGVWNRGATDEEIADNIRNGNVDLGMVPYREVLTDEQIRSLVIFLREKEYQEKVKPVEERPRPEDGLYESELHNFRLELIVEEPDIFWSLDFLPDGRIIASQKSGALRIIEDGVISPPIEGTPDVWDFGQGGLLEVQLHPDYARNGWIYLAIAESVGAGDNGKETGMTAVARGRIKDGRWVDGELIFQVPPEFHRSSGAHFGSRFVFADGYLFFSIGDRGASSMAQDLSRPNGKIHRIFDDGRIPEDNPFYDESGAFKSIWSYGHRNPQGLDRNPATGALWSTEHGPRGGDELNVIQKGRNYGWPVITYGMGYDGKPITDKTSAPGMEQPKHYWVPSIGASGIDFYTGDHFPEWKNDLFIGGMVTRELHRFRIVDGVVLDREIVLKNQGRVRDVHSGPDGHLYVILNGAKRQGPSGIYRLVSE